MAKKKAKQQGGRKANEWKLVTFVDIEKFLKKAGASQLGFAKAVGVTNSTFHNWKNGRSAPSEEVQKKIKKVIKGKIALPEPKSPVKTKLAQRRASAAAPAGKLSRKKKKAKRRVRGHSGILDKLPDPKDEVPKKPKKAQERRKKKTKKAKKRKTPLVRRRPTTSDNGEWTELGLLGQFIRANTGRTVDEFMGIVSTVAEANG